MCVQSKRCNLNFAPTRILGYYWTLNHQTPQHLRYFSRKRIVFIFSYSKVLHQRNLARVKMYGWTWFWHGNDSSIHNVILLPWNSSNAVWNQTQHTAHRTHAHTRIHMTVAVATIVVPLLLILLLFSFVVVVVIATTIYDENVRVIVSQRCISHWFNLHVSAYASHTHYTLLCMHVWMFSNKKYTKCQIIHRFTSKSVFRLWNLLLLLFLVVVERTWKLISILHKAQRNEHEVFYFSYVSIEWIWCTALALPNTK